MSKKDKKQEKIDDLVKATYRDMGQTLIMKRKMIRAIIFAILATIALAIFVALYLDEAKRVQETYRTQYKVCLDKIIYDIDSYLNAEGDLEFRYRRLVADMNSVASFAFLLEDFTEKQKTINELYTAFLKYPEQMSGKLEEARQAIQDMIDNLDKGYEEADAIVASVDLKGY